MKVQIKQEVSHLYGVQDFNLGILKETTSSSSQYVISPSLM